MLETFVAILAKSINIEQLMESPKVKEALAIAAQIRDDFAALKAGQAEVRTEINNILSRLETMDHGRNHHE